MPMGYTDSPGYLSRFTVGSVRDYIDNFVGNVHPGTKEEHWKRVKQVLAEMRKRKMSIKLRSVHLLEKKSNTWYL